jgi:nucleoside 2-deoxyribosyltransferase
MADPEDEWDRWLEHVRDKLIPMVRKCHVSLNLVPGDPDPKFCVELGVAMMLDKPIIALVRPGVKLPLKLAKVADEIVEVPGGPQTKETAQRIQEAIERVMREVEE